MDNDVYGDNDRLRESQDWDALQSILAEQARNINELTKTIGVLSHSLSQLPTRRDSLRALVTVVIVVLIFLGGTFVTSAGNQRILERLDDCLTEGGVCYEEQSARQAKAVQELTCNDEIIVRRAFEQNGMTFEISPECEVYLQD